MKPHTRITFDDFFTGILGALAEAKQSFRLPVRNDFSSPLDKIMPDVEKDAESCGLDLAFHYRTDACGESLLVENAKTFAYQRGLLEFRSMFSLRGNNYFWLTDLPSDVFLTFPESQRNFYRRTAKALLKEFRDRGVVFP